MEVLIVLLVVVFICSLELSCRDSRGRVNLNPLKSTTYGMGEDKADIIVELLNKCRERAGSYNNGKDN